MSTVYIPLKINQPDRGAPPTAIGALHVFSDDESAKRISKDVMTIDIDNDLARRRLRDMARKMVHTQLLMRSK